MTSALFLHLLLFLLPHSWSWSSHACLLPSSFELLQYGRPPKYYLALVAAADCKERTTTKTEKRKELRGNKHWARDQDKEEG